MRRLLWTLCIVTSLVAGCAGDPAAPEPTATTTTTPDGDATDGNGGADAALASSATAEGKRVEVFEFQGERTVAAAGTIQNGDGDYGFATGPNATRIVMTLEWDGPATDLDPVLLDPRWTFDAGTYYGAPAGMDAADGWWGVHEGTPANPDNPSVLELDANDLAAAGCATTECAWTAVAYDKATVQTAFLITVEVHYEASDAAVAPDA